MRDAQQTMLNYRTPFGLDRKGLRLLCARDFPVYNTGYKIPDYGSEPNG
jgi:hypothetical protein